MTIREKNILENIGQRYTPVIWLRDQLPFIQAWIKVGDSFPSIAFDSSLIICPDLDICSDLISLPKREN